MDSTKKHIAISIFIAILSLFSFSGRALALTISPARIELKADPGQIINGEFTLTNEQEDTKTFYSSAANFEAQGETGTPTFTNDAEGLASWVKLIPEVTLAKGETQKIDFTVTVPQDADAGGHFAAIFLSTSPNSASTTQVSIGAKIGVLLLLRVSGDIKESGGIIDFNTKDKSTMFTSLPINFTYRFNNTGSDRVSPMGYLFVTNIIGGETFRTPANQSQGNVLPGSTRKFDITWDKNIDDKNNIPPATGFFATAGYQWRNFALGRYTAHLSLSYGENRTAAESSIVVYVIPWQLLIIILIGLIIFFFMFAIALKRYNSWIIKNARKKK